MEILFKPVICSVGIGVSVDPWANPGDTLRTSTSSAVRPGSRTRRESAARPDEAGGDLLAQRELTDVQVFARGQRHATDYGRK